MKTNTKTGWHMQIAIILLLVLCTYGSTFAGRTVNAVTNHNPGTYRLKGHVADAEQQQPLRDVSVILYSARDSSMIAGTITNFEGNFCITASNPEDCYLVLLQPGFMQHVISLAEVSARERSIHLGDIHLEKIPVQALSARK